MASSISSPTHVHNSQKPVVPGTVQLIDVDHVSALQHAKGPLSDVVLVPTPSNNPDDPLNWSKWRKLMSTFTMCVYIMMVGLAASCIYSIIVPISLSTGLTLNDLNAGTGYQYLAFGWGCLVWQPLAQQFGKRPIYLLSMLLTLGVTISVPYVHTPGTWLLLKVLQGFVGAPIESLGEISISDVYFTHQRGTYMALYAFTLYTSGFLAPVFSGFINDGQEWQWVQYWCGIWLAGGFVFNFFFMEETNFDRPSLLETAPAVATTPSDYGEALGSEGKLSAEAYHLENVTTIDPNRKPKTYLQRLSLLDKKRPLKSLPQRVIRPLYLLSFPVIFYCGFSYGCSLIWYNVLNATASLILSAPPYNFRPSSVGLAYFAPLVGVVIGTVFTGTFGDKVVLKICRRNGGVWHSEHRLWLFIVSVILVPASLILWGVGASHSVHWFGLIFAMVLTGAAVTIGAQLAISYCIDSYKDLGADAIVSVIIVRNTMSFAIGYGVTPWIENMGLQNAFLVAAFAGMAQVLTFLIFVKWGPGLRAQSAERYWRAVKKGEEIGSGAH